MGTNSFNGHVTIADDAANRLGKRAGLDNHDVSEMDRRALISFEDRPSDSPYVDRVWRSHSDYAGMFHSMASCHWGIVITRLNGRATLTVRGPETKATMAECPAEGEWFGVQFKIGTYMPLMRCGGLRDRNDVNLPNATRHSFWLNGSAWDFPTFENAETFVLRLVHAGLIRVDRTVEGTIRGELQQFSTRTEQRRMLEVTGLSHAAIHQIERARRATLLLRRGVPILDVVDEAGYYDQAHLTRSLQRFVGQTPGRVARGEGQLSLLYNQ
ncbi:MAG TPA: AraC family transcriptional regulator [Chthoniobacteraceae bacterium]|nr:AraC family transcriptional regulator [Chthoniobacteraceae bacterium]